MQMKKRTGKKRKPPPSRTENIKHKRHFSSRFDSISAKGGIEREGGCI